MLRVLLAKDLRRAWRNPLPWLINLIVPLAMTALLGLVFGGKSDNGALGRICFAVVDEDKSVLSDVLRGAANQREGGKYLEPVFLEREDALRQLNDSKLSAVLIIPQHFMRNYLTAREAVSLELIKNPAESIHPAVLEELLGAVVTTLNAISRNFNSEFPEWQSVFEGNEDYHKVSFLIERAGQKFKMAKRLIDPPLVTYEKDDSDSTLQKAGTSEGNSNGASSGDTNHVAGKTAAAKKGKPKQDDSRNVFAFLLVGLAAMFLLFLGNNAMTDLQRELRNRTFERYQTMHQQLGPFILGKVVFAVVILLICSAVMLGGGGLIFGIHWQRPIPLIWLSFGYAAFVATLFAVLVALIPEERRSTVLTNLASMGLGLVGGCAFPPQQLPGFLRDHVTPLMPTNWFVETARDLQFSSEHVGWGMVLLKLALASVILLALAAVLFQRRFRAGLRA